MGAGGSRRQEREERRWRRGRGGGGGAGTRHKVARQGVEAEDFDSGTGRGEGRLRQGEEPLPAFRCRGSFPSQLRYKTRGRHDRCTPGGLLGTRPPARRRLGSCAGCGCCLRSWPSPPPGPRPAQVTARAPVRSAGGRPLGVPSRSARRARGARRARAAWAPLWLRGGRADGADADPRALPNGHVRRRSAACARVCRCGGWRGPAALGPARVRVSDVDASRPASTHAAVLALSGTARAFGPQPVPASLSVPPGLSAEGLPPAQSTGGPGFSASHPGFLVVPFPLPRATLGACGQGGH